MGRKRGGSKTTKHVRTIWKQIERSVKRDNLQAIADICGTTREHVGEVVESAAFNDIYDDASAAAKQRADNEHTPTTAGDSSAASAAAAV